MTSPRDLLRLLAGALADQDLAAFCEPEDLNDDTDFNTDDAVAEAQLRCAHGARRFIEYFTLTNGVLHPKAVRTEATVAFQRAYMKP